MSKNMTKAKVERILQRRILAEKILERDDLSPYCIKEWEKELKEVEETLGSLGGK